MSKWLLVFFATLAVALPAQAHHSFAAQFDISQPISLEGKVTSMEWSNPHAWIHIEVTGEDGSKVDWSLETGAAANILIRRGWRPAHLPEGTHVIVQGWLARNGTNTANIKEIRLDDGTRLLAGAADTTPGYED